MTDNLNMETLDYAVIGMVVSSFSTLEHELVRACIGICGGPKNLSDNDKQKIENSLNNGDALHNRIELFCALARKRSEYTADEISQFEENLKEGVVFRNLICHGQWDKVPSGKLRITFYNKGCIFRGHAQIAEFSHNGMTDLAQLTLRNAKILSEY